MFDRILPEELLAELDQIGVDLSQRAARTMFITHSIITTLEQAKTDIVTGRVNYAPMIANRLLAMGRMDVYKFVGKRVGRKSRTVRYWYAVHSFIENSDKWRDALDLLPFTHLVESAKYGEHSEKALDFTLAYLKQNGRACSVDMIEGYMVDALKPNSDSAQYAIEIMEADYPDIPSVNEHTEHTEERVTVSERIVIQELRRVAYIAVKALPQDHPLYSLVEQICELLKS